MTDLSVSFAGINMKNPLITASGTCGYGREMAELFDLSLLGGISIKGTTPEPRKGNPPPRIAEASCGLLNSVGLQNPGVDAVIAEELPKLRKVFDKPVMANVSGFSVEEYSEVTRRLSSSEAADIIGWFEINISCPNVHGGGMSFGTDPCMAASVVKAVRGVTDKHLIIKLSPNVTDIAGIARACEAEGADGLSLINTLMGLRFDLRTGRPILANTTGGLSGPAVLPVALRMVYQVSNAVSIPVVGMGGVSSAEDVIEMMMAGASAVEVGAANLVDPFACRDMIRELPAAMQKYGISRFI